VKSLKAGAGHPPICGVQGLAAHGLVDRSFDASSIAVPSEASEPGDLVFLRKVLV
jgi:hypothetical protein